MSWMARCKVLMVGALDAGALEELDGAPVVVLLPATEDDLRMLGGAIYQRVYVEPKATPTPEPTR